MTEPSISCLISFKINDQAAAQAIFNLHHTASHDTVLALSDVLGESSHHFIVLEPVFAGVLEKLESIVLRGLLLERNCEYDILHRLKQLRKSSHVHCHLTVVMLSAVHGLKQFLAHLHRITVLVADGDHARNVEHRHVARHGQVLVRGELSQVPLWTRPLLEARAVWFLRFGNGSFRSCSFRRSLGSCCGL